MTLNKLILDKIRQQKSISFAEFMQIALYDPSAGYYTVGIQQFGQDFTTAPEISPLFGACLANQCAEIVTSLTQPHILEFGAGSGRLCVDILKKLEQLNCLPESYLILELSGTLQAQQKQTIGQEIPHLLSKIQWIQTWPTDSFQGVILANEVLDAMPVHRFLQSEHELYEIHITADANGQLSEVLQICDNQLLRDHVKQVLDLDLYPYQSEVNLWINDWLQQCAQVLEKGVVLLIDYGFPRREYYHPDRNQGTLMCHYQHRSHTNPLEHIGKQDITAHVDFTHVAEAAYDAGFSVAGFSSQASFLLANGLLSLVNAEEGTQRFRQQQAVKCLTHPSEMGELFKVMAVTKNWPDPLSGFLMQDRRASL